MPDSTYSMEAPPSASAAPFFNIGDSRQTIRRSRRKTRAARSKDHLAWEQHDLTTNGFYHRYLVAIMESLPMLSVTEARVAALAAGLLPSKEIARILGITEHSIENYRSRIRKKIDLPKNVGLTKALQHLVLQSFRSKAS